MLYVTIILVLILLAFLLFRLIIVQHLVSAIVELSKENPDKIIEADAIGVKRIAFDSGNRILYANWFEFDRTAPTVFIVHGNGESLGDWLGVQQLLHTMGYNSFVFDYSGFGSSEGKPSIKKLKADTQNAWRLFCEKTQCSSKRIVAAHSLGVAIFLDAINCFDMKPDHIILHGAFSSARAMTILYGKVSEKWAWLIPDLWNNKKNIRKINHIDTHIFHSKVDQKIPFGMAVEIAGNSGENRLHLFENYDHSAIYALPEKEFWSVLLSINT